LSSFPLSRGKVLEVSAGRTGFFFGNETLWSGLIALAVALALAAWVRAASPFVLIGSLSFARRIAAGELSVRLDYDAEDPLSSIEVALNQAAERLDKSFAEIESRRQELANLLDSMQEAVVAITSEGLVRWSNAQMQRIAGTRFALAVRWFTRCATPNCWLA
jgi:two-component system phosphate regulon sensor histidine kinase PhoR